MALTLFFLQILLINIFELATHRSTILSVRESVI